MAGSRFDAAGFLAALFAEPAEEFEQVLTQPALTPEELSAPWREMFEERVAIREHDGGQAREHAEAEALAEVLDAMKAAEHSR